MSCQGRTPLLTEVPSAVYNLDEPLAPGVESKWWEVAELTKVDLSRNAIVFLPEGMEPVCKTLFEYTLQLAPIHTPRDLSSDLPATS